MIENPGGFVYRYAAQMRFVSRRVRDTPSVRLLGLDEEPTRIRHKGSISLDLLVKRR
jgi:hypothetical protein